MSAGRPLVATVALATAGAAAVAGTVVYAGSMSVVTSGAVSTGSTPVAAACSSSAQVELGDPHWSPDLMQYVVEDAIVTPTDLAGCEGHAATVTITDAAGHSLTQGSRVLSARPTRVTFAHATSVAGADGIAVLIQ